jgi:hypothetical protein
MLALGALFHAYYGTALPLPYYMKTFTQSFYDPHVRKLGQHVKGWYVACFVCFSAPLWWLAAWRRDAVTLALVSSAAAFFVYHWVFTYEFMGSRSRFYAPAVVPLVLAAARSWDHFSERVRPTHNLLFLFTWSGGMAVAYQARWVPTHEGFFLDQIHWPAYAATGTAWTVFLLGGAWVRRQTAPRTVLGLTHAQGLILTLGVSLALGLSMWWKPKRPNVLNDEQTLRKASGEASTTRGMFDVVRCLPHAKNVYHSEMGITGLALIHLRTVDMVGLLSKDTVLHDKSFEQYCSEDRPEAIFLPHKNYQRLNQIIADSNCFKDYRQMTVRSSSPLYVRADLAADFQKCGTEIKRWR